MRIVLIGPAPPFRGGIARYTAHLQAALAQRHTVRLVSYSRQYPGWLYPGQGDLDPNAGELLIGERLLDQVSPVSWVRTARIISRYQPDVVIVQWWQSFGAPCTGYVTRVVSRSARVPILAICHNFVAHERRRLDVLATRVGLGATSGLLVQSEEDLRSAGVVFPDKTRRRINLPVWQDLQHLEVPSLVAKEKLGLRRPVLLFFGLVRPYKGLRDLLSAMPEVRRKVDAALLIVGEFWEDRREYERLVTELGLNDRVRIVDRFVSDSEMALYFCASDLVVLPYRTATQSGVVGSAYAFQRPVVTTGVGGLEDMVVDGSSGHVVPPRDIPALADAIVHALERGAPDSYAAGIAQARTHLSWASLVNTIEEATEEITVRS